MMKIAIFGYGKMGHAIERLATRAGHQIILVVDQNNRQHCTDEDLKQADVAIEFSTPSSAVDNYLWCFRLGIPVVSGTTGWLDRWDEVIAARVALRGRFFYASNFSIGVNIFFHLNRHLARVMSRFPSYGAHIEETHHVHKLDAPSGTAITLARDLIAEHGGYTSWHLRDGNETADVLPVVAHREGEVTGIHQVTYQSPEDEIIIRHSAYTRDSFARGAILAAEFLHRAPAGLYNMNDLLQLDK